MENPGYQVKLTHHALAALSEIESHGFDVLLLDFDLTGMDGCELACVLRQRRVTTPIIAISASAHGDEGQRARAAGIDACVRKPVSAQTLRETLDASVGITRR